MAVQEPPARPASQLRLRWLFWALVALVGILAVVGILVLGMRQTSAPAVMPQQAVIGGPAATWAAGARPAPSFTLRDATGRAVTLAQYRGRSVLVTFLDPLCHTFCPRESLVINAVLRRLPAAQRPPVIAVNVNPPVQSPVVLNMEAQRFRWLPQWRWANGTKRQLAAVWHDYDIAVLPTPGDVTHTEGVYLVDAKGNERALFLWPFTAQDVLRSYTQLR